MTKYLNLDKLEYQNNIVEIDDLIAETILELNKKGYNTIFSCSGHSDKRVYSSSAPIEYKDDVINEGYAIYGEDDKNVYYSMLNPRTITYVKFDGPYDFESIPEGFEYETAEEAYKEFQILTDTNAIRGADDIVFGDCIRKNINLIDENGKMRTNEEVDKEIEAANKVLLEWSKSLKPVNIKNR